MWKPLVDQTSSLLLGYISGVAGLIIGSPLDVLKVIYSVWTTTIPGSDIYTESEQQPFQDRISPCCLHGSLPISCQAHIVSFTLNDVLRFVFRLKEHRVLLGVCRRIQTA